MSDYGLPWILYHVTPLLQGRLSSVLLTKVPRQEVCSTDSTDLSLTEAEEDLCLKNEERVTYFQAPEKETLITGPEIVRQKPGLILCIFYPINL